MLRPKSGLPMGRTFLKLFAEDIRIPIVKLIGSAERWNGQRLWTTVITDEKSTDKLIDDVERFLGEETKRQYSDHASEGGLLHTPLWDWQDVILRVGIGGHFKLGGLCYQPELHRLS